jgi:hypothetical protein
VDAKKALGLARGQVLAGVVAKAPLELGKRGRGHGEADGEGVAAEAREEIGAALNGCQQHESIDGAAGAVGHSVFNADYDGGLGGALNYARSEDAYDAAMPAVAVDDQKAVGGAIEVRLAGRGFNVSAETGFDDGQGNGLGIATFLVEALELGGQFGGADGVARGKKLDNIGGHVHAAGGVDARGEPEGDVEAGELLVGGVEPGCGEEGAQPGAGWMAQLTQAQRGDGSIFSVKRHRIGDGGDGSHFEKAGQDFFASAGRIAALEQGLGEFESDGRTAERFFRISAAMLVGIENRMGAGNGVIGFGQMMIGDDEVETEALMPVSTVTTSLTPSA